MSKEIVLTDETRQIMLSYLKKQWKRQEKRLAEKEAKKKANSNKK